MKAAKATVSAEVAANAPALHPRAYPRTRGASARAKGAWKLDELLLAMAAEGAATCACVLGSAKPSRNGAARDLAEPLASRPLVLPAGRRFALADPLLNMMEAWSFA